MAPVTPTKPTAPISPITQHSPPAQAKWCLEGASAETGPNQAEESASSVYGPQSGQLTGGGQAPRPAWGQLFIGIE